jgi:putative 4-mercaptohistidine N1-methyltranferase
MPPNPYESRRLVDEYLLFHYGADADILPWESGPADGLRFPVRTVEETFAWGDLPATARALDVGCAVGRSAFELSRRCAEVIGIDFSQAFIDAAETLRTVGRLDYACHEEAHVHSLRTARIPEGARPDHVRFRRGDAMDLDPASLGTFDLVHAANLVCRLPDPARFLDRLPALARPGGQLVLTTPCTWMEEFTPPDRWPTHATLDFLREHLEPAFALRRTVDLPFLIREHRRKFQWSVAQGSVWTRA